MIGDRKYVVTQDRWCWCGRPAALVVMRRHNKEVIEAVCSNDHGAMAIEMLRKKEG